MSISTSQPPATHPFKSTPPTLDEAAAVVGGNHLCWTGEGVSIPRTVDIRRTFDHHPSWIIHVTNWTGDIFALVRRNEHDQLEIVSFTGWRKRTANPEPSSGQQS